MTRLRFCEVCKCLKRQDIEYLIWRGATPMQIAEKYINYFNISVNSLYNKIRNHFKRKHPPYLFNPLPIDKDENGQIINDSLRLSNDWELDLKIKRS